MANRSLPRCTPSNGRLCSQMMIGIRAYYAVPKVESHVRRSSTAMEIVYMYSSQTAPARSSDGAPFNLNADRSAQLNERPDLHLYFALV